MFPDYAIKHIGFLGGIRMPKYNPFRPGSIVNPGMFCGRVPELIALEKVLFQTKNGNPQNFLIHGERGIGKSSLLFYLQCVANGKITSLENSQFKFLTLSVELEPLNSYFDIIRKIGVELQRVVNTHQKVKDLAKTAWDFIKRWEVFGVKYLEKQSLIQPNDLLDDLTHTMERTVEDIEKEFDGILIMVDEADKPPATSNLGEFTKIFTERLAKRGCNKVSLGLAGLSGIVKTLREGHESSPRVFEILTLEPLLPKERIDVIRKGLNEAKEKNGFEVTITQNAANCIGAFSEGYPHFIQQFAYSAFEEDTNNEIDEDDVFGGAFKENGAFQQLGLKYFHDWYFEQIGSDEYREVLRTMSQKLDGWVTKAEIRREAKIKESTLNNAISSLKRRKIIIPKPGRKGEYKLPNKSFAVWIKAYTQKPEKLCLFNNSTKGSE